MKRFLSVLLTIAMLLGMVTISAMAEGEEPLVIDVYDDAANYNGIQKGWFAKVIKDRFNIELDIIASAGCRSAPSMPPALKKEIWVTS